jgi:signal transduction histidine kinase
VKRALAACRTVRARLTLVYSGIFLAAGGALLVVTDVLVRHFADVVSSGVSGTVQLSTKDGGPGVAEVRVGGVGLPSRTSGAGKSEVVHALSGGLNTKVRLPKGLPSPTPKELKYLQQQANDLIAQVNAQHYALTHTLFVVSLLALVGIAIGSVVLGWLMAGRALRPLRVIASATRAISARNLHERLAYAGPPGEVKDLADTVDRLLERLEGAFEAERRFVANASHELRTPLARQRTLGEVALGDRDATVESLRAAHRRVLAAGAQQEQLIESLLTLARSDGGIDRQDPVDLAEVTREVLDARRPAACRSGIAIDEHLAPSTASGDRQLIERLIDNLVGNAVDHNLREGWVEISTATVEGRAVVTVANSGPVVPEAEVGRLLRPFQRLGRDRTGGGDHHGLGLAIVQAVVAAHEGELVLEALAGGGLRVVVSLPASPHSVRQHAVSADRTVGPPATGRAVATQSTSR